MIDPIAAGKMAKRQSAIVVNQPMNGTKIN